MTKILGLLIIPFTFAFVNTVLSQSFDLKKEVLSSGGGEGQSQSFILKNTIGEMTMGSGISAGYSAIWGFWNSSAQNYASISGKKYLDTNADSSISGDAGLSGWVIKLYRDSCILVARTVTDANGYYLFDSLVAGTYTVEESLKVGWVQTYPRIGDTNVVTTKCHPNNGTRSYSFTISSGDTITNANFGNGQRGSICGVKFEDVNGNGARDIGEPGLPGWTILLQGPVTQFTQTDANGNYCFTSIPPGYYIVNEAPQTGWKQTKGGYSFILPSGASNDTCDFGNYEYGSISGTMFHDKNGNGIIESGEYGIDGWKLYLFKNNSPQPVDSLTVDNGSYLFDSLLAGTYSIREQTLIGWYRTTPPLDFIIIASGSVVTGKNIGVAKDGSIEGLVFKDINQNAIFDSAQGEYYTQGIVEIGLSSCGCWTVWITGDEGFPSYNISYDGIESYNGQHVAVWGNMETCFGAECTPTPILRIVQISTTIPPKPPLLDRRLPDWTVVLYHNDTLSSPVDTAVTDSTGIYKFYNVPAGTYYVREQVKPGWKQTTPNPLAFTVQSDSSVAVSPFGNIVEVQCELMEKWNMVSLPLRVADERKTTLFPSSISSAFKFTGSYVVDTLIERGIGYWLKFGAPQNVNIAGDIVEEDSLDVIAGWNMLGSLSDTVSTSCITPVGTSIESPFFGYNNGYVQSDGIVPCKAYWVKVSGNGQLVLRSNCPEKRLSKK
ncbi:MAG: hypothetical protein EPO24_14380 [Bacteroidetes bacterium]|nr:MAG: hypothetical protein EPO24_14380 [Bacteroidota bacterium]